MGWGDVVEALMRGTIDGLISPISTYSDYKLGQYLGTVINGDLGLPNLGALVMNQKSWDALPDDVKRVFNEEISSFAMNMHRNWHSVSEKIMLDYAKQAGMIIYEMTPDEKALLGNPIKMVWKKSIDDLEKKGIPASRILEAYQAAKGKGR
jgi:TRAP-type C4-dicarboxylate transport system substrate-binding protein